ncbi:hypothetical protein BJY04DRAFT_188265, partial [Aspergillus karnatakaensis]|uniref:uncharacterized protein n=1 Tax=Aspergillus karnatakaensis TaxID=1810916 RepID=UPI003CCE1796
MKGSILAFQEARPVRKSLRRSLTPEGLYRLCNRIPCPCARTRRMWITTRSKHNLSEPRAGPLQRPAFGNSSKAPAPIVLSSPLRL